MKPQVFISRSLALCTILLLFGCATTIPAVDTEKPRIEFRLTGPGVNQNMTNPPTEVWTGPGGIQLFNMEPNAEYRFSLIVSDQGGVARAVLQVPDIMNIDVNESAATISERGISKFITVLGNRAEPLTGLTITGTMSSPNGSTSFTFNAEGHDFGGRSGDTNSRYLEVNAFLD